MKISNKKEYIEAVCIRRQLRSDVAKCEEVLIYPSEYHVALTLIDIYSLMLTAYENGATCELTKEP